jgi:hypothetical protein
MKAKQFLARLFVVPVTLIFFISLIPITVLYLILWVIYGTKASTIFCLTDWYFYDYYELLSK